MCMGCGVCVDECPVGAISLEGDTAEIDDKECIRCGRCHDTCPQEAVRHDSERIPQEVEANIQWVNELRGKFETEEEKAGLMERMKRHFKKEAKVVQQTLEQLDTLG